MMRNKKRLKSGITDYWQSYSDMMAALLLMFILIMSSALLMADKNNNELKDVQSKIKRTLGVKPELISELKKELSEFNVYIDEETGDIAFESDILFDYDMDVLKEKGSQFLSQFMPEYLNIMLSEKYLPYIAEIIIEGHTDTKGSYLYNLKLSQDRALSVAEFCIGEDSHFVSGENLKHLRKIITVNGKSSTNPIYVDGKIDQEKSRRVEIKFRVKDDEAINILKQYMK